MKRFVVPSLLASLVSGCAVVPRPSQAELALVDQPPPAIQAKVDRLAPAAVAWISSVQPLATRGRPLTPSEAQFARQIGVANPDVVRVVVVDQLPMPEDEDLRREAAAHGMGSALEGGRTMGNIIFLKPAYAHDPEVLTHELTHVAQFQRLGTEPMIRRYITEMLLFSYSRMPLELEAFQHQTSDLEAASAKTRGGLQP